MSTARRTRILGNKLGLTIGGIDYWPDIAKLALNPETSDKDVVTFADAAGGSTAAWTLSGEAIISFDAGSFWAMVWEHAGETVPYILAPLGNREASTDAPHFVGRVKIGVKPGVSTEAGDTKGQTFEIEWECDGEPERATTGSTLGTGSQEDAPGTTPDPGI